MIIECLLTGKCLSLGPNDQLISPKSLILIYHLHGIRTNPSSIIISQEDYISLFRPNQYRQQKLSLSIKESTTLIIGYGLGDVNVLTAVDWTKNVYSNQRINYPHDIIQLLYVETPSPEPYRDRNDILIIEFNNLKIILEEITDLIKSERIIEDQNEIQLQKLNDFFKDPQEEDINKFVDNESFRISVINAISKYDIKLISGFLELFSKAIEKTWLRAEPNGAFYAYKENLVILLDIIVNIDLVKIPAALLESIAYNLNQVAAYVGSNMGESLAAHSTWTERKKYIPDDTKVELLNIAKTRSYDNLRKLFRK